MMISIVVSMIIANPYKNIVSTGAYIKAPSNRGGASFMAFSDSTLAFVSYVKAEYNKDGVIPILIVGDNGDDVLARLYLISEVGDGFIYEITHYYAIISLMKRSNSVTFLILNEDNGGTEGEWGQTIPLEGFASLYNSLY